MTDAELRIAIREEVQRAENHLGEKIDRTRERIDAHLGDRFAHGWDHRRLENSEEMVKEWGEWRKGVDRWRWSLMGALGFVAFEIPVAVTAIGWLVHR